MCWNAHHLALFRENADSVFNFDMMVNGWQCVKIITRITVNTIVKHLVQWKWQHLEMDHRHDPENYIASIIIHALLHNQLQSSCYCKRRIGYVFLISTHHLKKQSVVLILQCIAMPTSRKRYTSRTAISILHCIHYYTGKEYSTEWWISLSGSRITAPFHINWHNSGRFCIIVFSRKCSKNCGLSDSVYVMKVSITFVCAGGVVFNPLCVAEA